MVINSDSACALVACAVEEAREARPGRGDLALWWDRRRRKSASRPIMQSYSVCLASCLFGLLSDHQLTSWSGGG